jgi:hypothetical protein
MTECERESEVIEINTDITTPGANKKTNHTVTEWRESVFDKGLTFDFFSDPLVHKVILVTVLS